MCCFRPKRSEMGSRKEVDLNRSYTFRNSGKTYSGVPIMAANMDGVGTTSMALPLAKHGLFTVLKKDYSSAEVWDWLNNNQHKDDLCRTIAVSTGITADEIERTEKTLKLSRAIDYLCIDVANGYSERFLEAVSLFREKFPTTTIIAGNVVTPDITEELILRGADIVKVGIGPGSVCTTRIKTGVGYPQLSAVIECADAAHGLGGHIIADGGCSSSGDVVKAFGAGADFVMLGGMMAGTDESGFEVKDNMVEFYGSSTTQAQEDNGGVQGHRTSEGRIVRLPYKGSVTNVVTDVLGGLRSGCTYVGANKLKNLSKCTTFVKVNNGKTHNTVFENMQVGE